MTLDNLAIEQLESKLLDIKKTIDIILSSISGIEDSVKDDERFKDYLNYTEEHLICSNHYISKNLKLINSNKQLVVVK